MATLSSRPIGNLIEAASSQLADPQPIAAHHGNVKQFKPPRSEAKYSLAMAKRLEELQAALGEVTTTGDQATNCEQLANHASPNAGYRLRTLLFASLCSALLGASMTWQATKRYLPADEPLVRTDISPPVTATIPAITANKTPASPAIQTTRQAIAKDLETWRKAWMRRDIETYLAAYSPHFLPADGRSLDAWRQERRRKLAGKEDINLQLKNIQIATLDSKQATIHFLQSYVSGHYREIAQPKTLALVREGNDWKISREWQGTPPPTLPLAAQ